MCTVVSISFTGVRAIYELEKTVRHETSRTRLTVCKERLEQTAQVYTCRSLKVLRRESSKLYKWLLRACPTRATQCNAAERLYDVCIANVGHKLKWSTIAHSAWLLLYIV